MRIFAIVLFLFVGVVSFAQNSSIAGRAKSRMEAIRNRHADKVERLKAEHEAFRKEVMAKWGEKQMVESSQKVWVEYSDDKESRFSVDFEKGEVKVEVLSDKDEPVKITQEKIQKAVGSMLESRGKTVDFKSEVVEQKPVADKPILENQIKVVPKEVAAKSSSHSHKEVSTSGGVKRVSSVVLQLNPDHLNQRAQKVRPYVEKYAKMYGIDVPLVFAIIEQESAFNRMARSGKNAYGLMQLVPKYGGKDAYMYVFKIDDEPEPEFLYDEENNIMLGTAYIRILMTREFPTIKEKINKMLCTIAAYNTGAGNVARAFTGKLSVSGAAGQINAMSNGQLYNYLRENLHHPEARGYVKGVTEKMKKYVK